MDNLATFITNYTDWKLLLIFCLAVGIFFSRNIIINFLISLVLKVEFIEKNSKELVIKLKKPFEVFISLLNLNMIFYIFNDLNNTKEVATAFNVGYTSVVLWSVIIIVNEVTKQKIQAIEESSQSIKRDVINLAIKAINFVIVMIGLLVILHFLGVNLTAVLSGLGIGGLAVALAAKDTLSNFFGTISILISNTFSQGDWIVVDGKEGTVVEIGLRVTTIRTFDNALIAIPNAVLANSDVKNWNKRVFGRRIKMKIGVKYDSKKEDIQNAVYEIREMLKNHPDIATQKNSINLGSKKQSKLVSKADEFGVKKTLLVYLDEFADSSINILVYCFSKSVMWEDWLRTKEDVMYKIMDILKQNNLDFAFPSLSIYKEN